MNSRHGRAPTHLAILMALFLVAWAVTALDHVDAQDTTPDQMVKAKWEIVTYTGTATIRRTRTPSGWFVVIQSDNGDNDPMMVLDPDHTWLKKKKSGIQLEHTEFSEFVAKEQETYNELIPALQRYMKDVARDPRKTKIQKTLDEWKARLDEAQR